MVWALALTVAAALIMQPAMGEGIQATNGPTATDFVTALYAAGGSLAIVGASDFAPHGAVWKLYFLFNSLVGASIISLTLTYLMQVYSALLRRNSLALTLHELTNETDDAAELICGLGPRGDFQTGATTLAELSSAMATMKETHHFYPVLFYFRFPETFYSVSQMTLVALDTVSLIKSALDNDQYATLQCSGSQSEARDHTPQNVFVKQLAAVRRPYGCCEHGALGQALSGCAAAISAGGDRGHIERAGRARSLSRLAQILGLDGDGARAGHEIRTQRNRSGRKLCGLALRCTGIWLEERSKMLLSRCTILRGGGCTV